MPQLHSAENPKGELLVISTEPNNPHEQRLLRELAIRLSRKGRRTKFVDLPGLRQLVAV